jgi:hypothetical protein
MASRPKFEEQEVIQFVGLKDLSASDQGVVQNLTAKYYNQLKRYTKNFTSLVIHVKSYEKKTAKGTEKTRGKKKYSVHIKVAVPTRTFASSKAVDWDLNRVIHQAFKNVEGEIVHRFKDDVSYKKPYV